MFVLDETRFSPSRWPFKRNRRYSFVRDVCKCCRFKIQNILTMIGSGARYSMVNHRFSPETGQSFQEGHCDAK